MIDWVKHCYGAEGEFVFHFVLAPAMQPGGGYGSTVVRPEQGRRVTHVYQIIRDAESVDGSQLAELTLHEFGHSFVNPAIGDRVPQAALPALDRLWKPVQAKMTDMSYGALGTFLNELVFGRPRSVPSGNSR